jgi:hypothetical protein
MASDPDYKANQRDAQKVWRDAKPEYYKEYLKKNDAYTKKNGPGRRIAIKIDGSICKFRPPI